MAGDASETGAGDRSAFNPEIHHRAAQLPEQRIVAAHVDRQIENHVPPAVVSAEERVFGAEKPDGRPVYARKVNIGGLQEVFPLIVSPLVDREGKRQQILFGFNPVRVIFGAEFFLFRRRTENPGAEGKAEKQQESRKQNQSFFHHHASFFFLFLYRERISLPIHWKGTAVRRVSRKAAGIKMAYCRAGERSATGEDCKSRGFR